MPDPLGWVADGFIHLRLATAMTRAVRVMAGVDSGLAGRLDGFAAERMRRSVRLPGGEVVAGRIADDPRIDDPGFWTAACARYEAAGRPQDATPARLDDALTDRPTAPHRSAGEWPPGADPTPEWRAAGAALVQWAVLAPLFRDTVDARSEWAGLVAPLRQLARSGAGGPAMAAAAEAMAGLVGVGLAAVGRADSELARVVHAVRGSLAAVPQEWPPLAVRDGLGALSDWGEAELTEDRIAAPAGLPPVVARIRLAAELTSACDRATNAGKAPQTVRPAVAEAVRRLLTPVGLAARVDFKPTARSRLTPVEGRTVPWVRSAGLTVTDPPGHVVWQRAGEVEVPPPITPLLAALRAAAGTGRPELSPLCREAERVLGDSHGADPTWWAGRPVEECGVWARLLIRTAVLATDGLAADLLSAAHEAGISLEAARPGVEAVPGPWFVLPAESEPGAGRRWAVRFPDGRLVGPSVWVSVAPPRDRLARCLADCEPLLAGLAARDSGWDGWREYNDVIWRWAYDRPAGNLDARAAWAAFEAVYRRANAAASPFPDQYHELAKRLYACLGEELGVGAELPLDPDTLTPAPVSPEWARARPGQVEWASGGEVPGEVLKVLDFPRPSEGVAARVRAGVGPKGGQFLAWLTLPTPPPGHLLEWQRAAVELLFNPDDRSSVDAHRRRVVTWLASAEGVKWLNQVGPEHPWVGALISAKWCQLYPPLGSDGRRCWPLALGLTCPKVSWAFDAAVKPGGLIADPVFAVDPADAGGRFSLGPAAAGDGIRAAAALVRMARGAPAVETVWQTEVAAQLGAEADRVAAARALAQWLARAPGEAESVVRDWFRASGLRLLPSDNSPPEDATAVFDVRVPAGRLIVRRYGVQGSEVDEPADIAVSAGPAPEGLAELERAAAASGRQELTSLLEQWPAAAQLGTLEYRAVDFFEAAWAARVGADGGRVGPVTDALAPLLEREFGLVEFRPTTIRGLQGGWAVHPRTPRPKTGRVLKVIRPGLTKAGECQVPAEVEVE